MDLLCRKGYYPYEWVDNDSKLNYKGLPPIEKYIVDDFTQGNYSSRNVYEVIRKPNVTDLRIN